MYKHINRISFAFSILLLISCSQSGDSEKLVNEGNASLNQELIEPEPYPSIFTDLDVPLIDGAFVLNKKELKNSKNKTGMQVWEKSEKSFDEIKAYYLENLAKNGWERKTDADKHSTSDHERDEAPVKYFVTKFHKEQADEGKKFVLLLNITSGNEGKITIIKILKEI